MQIKVPHPLYLQGLWHFFNLSTVKDENMEKEPSVIMAFYNGDKYEINETLAEDLGDFLLQLVQEQLEN